MTHLLAPLAVLDNFVSPHRRASVSSRFFSSVSPSPQMESLIPPSSFQDPLAMKEPNSTAIVPRMSPYFYEKHMLHDAYDAHGIRQGAWEIGICNCRACLPMTCCICFALPGIATAQMAARMSIRSYGWALLKEFFFAIMLLGLPFASYFLLIKMQAYSADDVKIKIPNIKDAGKQSASAAETLTMLGLWITFCGWIVIALFAVLALSELRFRIRTRSQIPGSSCSDLCHAAFLPTCAIAQMSTHLRCLRPASYSIRCPETLPPYEY